MKKFLLGLLVGLIVAVLAGVILVFAMARMTERRPVVADSSVLMLRVQGEVPETPPVEMPFPMLEQSPPLTMQDHREVLQKAAVDNRIRAVVLVPQGAGLGWAKMDEFYQSLVEFKKSGKPLYAYLKSPGAREYYIAMAADRVYMAPEDLLDVKGLRAEVMFLKEGLSKLGVSVEIERAGDYKSFGEMFTRTNMSPESREVINSMLDRLYHQFLQTAAEGRKKSLEEMRALVDKGPFLADQAAAAGMVDGLLYEDEMLKELEKQVGVKELRRVGTRDYARITMDSLKIGGRSRVALIVAEGSILRGEAPRGLGSQTVISSEGFSRLLRQVRDDDQIKGAIVRIDSPGGDAFASDVILREMKLLSGKKPTVISMGDSAASGGYYMAMTGDPVIAYPGTVTGSIGVFYGKVNLRGLYDKLGVQKELVSRGLYAEIDSDYRPLSPAERAKLKEGVENTYRVFLERVAEGRKRTKEEIRPLAGGRVWLGSQAKENGLVDEIGGMDRAIAMVKERANIPVDERVRVVVYPQRRSFWDALFERREAALENPFAALAARFLGRLALPDGVMAMMPFQFEVQ